MTMKNLLALVAVGSLALAFAGATAQPSTTDAQPTKEEHKDKEYKNKKDAKKTDKKSEATAVVGSMAPDFELTDTDGKTHKLSDLTKAGHTVVLQWFNPDCPFVVKHYKDNNTFNDLAKNYKDKKVILLAVNSNASGKPGAGKERNAKAKTDWKMEYPVLLDESGTVGKPYGARNTPAMYIIKSDGILAYKGAIDDDAGDTNAGKTNYVTKALDEILAGKEVSTKETKAYGCSVKY
jgi:peroxiredoxin